MKVNALDPLTPREELSLYVEHVSRQLAGSLASFPGTEQEKLGWA